MKNFSILVIGLSLLICNYTAVALSSSDNAGKATLVKNGTTSFKVSSSQELFHLAQTWVSDYKQVNPTAEISVDQLESASAPVSNHLNLISGAETTVLKNPSNWKMVVGRDVIVPIVNAKNPMFSSLHRLGISPDKIAQLVKDGQKSIWSEYVPNGQDVLVHLYLSNNGVVKTVLTNYTKTAVSAADGIKILTPAEVIEAVQNDQFAVGFCLLSDLRSAANANVCVLPIDKNGNGRMDNFENIYGNLDEFTHGVWIGKYPTALSNNIYAVSSIKPTDENELAFLSWIMMSGQNQLTANGYCDLTGSEKQANLLALLSTKTGGNKDNNSTSVPQNWPVALSVLALVGLFALLYFYSRKRIETGLLEKEIQVAPLLIENVVDVPKGLYFDKTHTWAFMEKDGNVKVGMDDFLQHITGKITKVSMKEVGEIVRKGEKIVTIIRDGKQLSLYAPISGFIVKQNSSLKSNSSLVNSSPYTDGWVYQIEPKNWLREIQFMFMGEKYAEWLQNEFVRLRDFIAASVKTNELVYAHVILQDGGELTDNVLADMEPKMWEDFQTKFIDTSK